MVSGGEKGQCEGPSGQAEGGMAQNSVPGGVGECSLSLAIQSRRENNNSNQEMFEVEVIECRPSSASTSRSEAVGPGPGSGIGKKRIRTSALLDDVDKKFLLEQYVSERQNNVNVQLQNRVAQLERELQDKERQLQDKDRRHQETERIHLETLGLAETQYRSQLLSEIGRLMEAEFNCSICNEVYIEPAVMNCGHTFCNYCINRALQSDFLCPVCRTGYNFNPPAKNVEMRNFINKLYLMLPEDVRAARDTAVEERSAEPPVNPRTARAVRAATSPTPLVMVEEGWSDLDLGDSDLDIVRFPLSDRGNGDSDEDTWGSDVDSRLTERYHWSPSPITRRRSRSSSSYMSTDDIELLEVPRLTPAEGLAATRALQPVISLPRPQQTARRGRRPFPTTRAPPPRERARAGPRMSTGGRRIVDEMVESARRARDRENRNRHRERSPTPANSASANNNRVSLVLSRHRHRAGTGRTSPYGTRRARVSTSRHSRDEAVSSSRARPSSSVPRASVGAARARAQESSAATSSTSRRGERDIVHVHSNNEEAISSSRPPPRLHDHSYINTNTNRATTTAERPDSQSTSTSHRMSLRSSAIPLPYQSISTLRPRATATDSQPASATPPATQTSANATSSSATAERRRPVGLAGYYRPDGGVGWTGLSPGGNRRESPSAGTISQLVSRLNTLRSEDVEEEREVVREVSASRASLETLETRLTALRRFVAGLSGYQRETGGSDNGTGTDSGGRIDPGVNRGSTAGGAGREYAESENVMTAEAASAAVAAVQPQPSRLDAQE